MTQKPQQQYSADKLLQLLKESRTRRLLLAIAVIVVVSIASLWTCQTVEETELNVEVDNSINMTPEIIESIKDIGEWEFLAIADEELVDTMRKGFFSDDHLVRIYYGTVRLGINMKQVEENWIETAGDSITVTLPKVGLLDRNFIDEARTKSFYESGRWTGADREALYHKAQQQMLSHCLTRENLLSAQQNGETQFRKMMRSMGFEHVNIRWSNK